MANGQANLKKLLGIYDDRLKILKEIGSMSLRIKEEMEKNREEAAEAVDSLTEERGVLLEKIKEAGMASRHSEAQLDENQKEIIKKVKSAVKSGAQPAFEQKWAMHLFKSLLEYKAELKSIKAADEKNAEDIKALMEEIKTKMKSVKENKRMMDKFSDDFSEASVGVLMKEKK